MRVGSMKMARIRLVSALEDRATGNEFMEKRLRGDVEKDLARVTDSKIQTNFEKVQRKCLNKNISQQKKKIPK